MLDFNEIGKVAHSKPSSAGNSVWKEFQNKK